MSLEADISDTVRRLQAMETKVRRKVLVKVGNAGSKPLLKAIKAATPVDTGVLRKSMGRKVKVYGAKGIMWLGVGPRSGFKQIVDGKTRNPTKYAHLTKIAHGDWMGAAAQGVAEQVNAEIERVLREELAKL